MMLRRVILIWPICIAIGGQFPLESIAETRVCPRVHPRKHPRSRIRYRARSRGEAKAVFGNGSRASEAESSWINGRARIRVHV
jgi:hypothetical protein